MKIAEIDRQIARRGALAARLARDGQSEPIHIEETDTTFAIGWKGRYRIDGPAFVYSDPTDKLSEIA